MDRKEHRATRPAADGGIAAEFCQFSVRGTRVRHGVIQEAQFCQAMTR